MSGFEDLFGDYVKTPEQRLADQRARLADQRRAQEQAQRDKTAVPQMRGKTIDGVKYMRAEDVVAALEATGSAVRVSVQIKKWLGR